MPGWCTKLFWASHSIELMLKDFVAGNFHCKCYRSSCEQCKPSGRVAGIEPAVLNSVAQLLRALRRTSCIFRSRSLLDLIQMYKISIYKILQ